MEERNETLASEVYRDLKNDLTFFKWLVALLIGALLTQGLYHNWRWSQFDRIAVDSQTGPATYVQGENTGGVNIGASGSTPEEGRQVQGDTD